MKENTPDCLYRVSIKALIFKDDGRFLCVQNANNLRGLPGGGLEYGETPQQCLKREIYEEVGLTTTDIAAHPSYFLRGLRHGKHKCNIIYRAKVQDFAFDDTREFTTIAFFNKEEVIAKGITPNTQAFLDIYTI